MTARQKISHAIRYKRNAEEPSTETNDARNESEMNGSSTSTSSETATDDDAASHDSIAVVSASGTDPICVVCNSVSMPTPKIDLFSDEELDSVLPIQFRVDPVAEVVHSNITAFLGVLQKWSIPPVEDEVISLGSDVQDFLLDSFQTDLI